MDIDYKYFEFALNLNELYCISLNDFECRYCHDLLISIYEISFEIPIAMQIYKKCKYLKNSVCISFTLWYILPWNVHIEMIFLLLSSIGTNRKLLSRNLYSWNEFENLSPRVYFTSRKLFKKHVEYYGFCCRRYGVSYNE